MVVMSFLQLEVVVDPGHWLASGLQVQPRPLGLLVTAAAAAGTPIASGK